jgi:hypothetical protein
MSGKCNSHRPGFSCRKEETGRLLIGAGKEGDMEVNTERTECMSGHRNAGQKNVKTTNGAFENAGKFAYLRTTPTNQNW